MTSRRVYITLNDQKEKDRIIEAYLSQSYSEADAIKEAIYRLAINNISMVNIDAISTEKEQLIPKDNKKDKVSKDNKKVQKGAESTHKVEKDTIPISDKEDAKGINSTEKEQKAIDDAEKAKKEAFRLKQEEMKKKSMAGLNYFNKR